jgi:5-methylcytosine-specific restriction endonuclease McrA
MGKNKRIKYEEKRKVLVEKLIVRDGLKCVYCGKNLSRHTITIDHIIPLSKNGNNDLNNLCIACKRCNTLKDNYTLKEFRKLIRDSITEITKYNFSGIAFTLGYINVIKEKVTFYQERKKNES